MSKEQDFNLDGFLAYQVSVLADRLSHEFARKYRSKFGLSRAEWRVMAHLSQQPSVSVREVASQANLDKPKVSRAVARLETAGHIRKQTAENDRRLVVLSLTAQGRKLVDDLVPLAHQFEAEVMARIDSEAGEQFRRALAALIEAAPRGT